MFLTWMMGAAWASGTAIPYAEVWGDSTSTSCSVHWSGKCETNWTGFGDSGALDLVDVTTTAGTGAGVLITPRNSTINNNGLYTTFNVASHVGDAFEWEVYVATVGGGTADFSVHLKFRNSSGTVLSTSTHTTTLQTEKRVKVRNVVPVGAATVDFVMGANDSSNGTNAIAVLGGGCLSVPGNFPDVGPESPFESCPKPEEDCTDCNISCPSGERAVSTCVPLDNPPVCTVIEECYCEDHTGTSELMQYSSYSSM